jgi:hypothetical protein
MSHHLPFLFQGFGAGEITVHLVKNTSEPWQHNGLSLVNTPVFKTNFPTKKKKTPMRLSRSM